MTRRRILIFAAEGLVLLLAIVAGFWIAMAFRSAELPKAVEARAVAAEEVSSPEVIEPVKKCRSLTDPVQEPEAVKEDAPTEPEVVNPNPTPAPPVSTTQEKLPDDDSGVPFIVPAKYWDGAMLLYRAGIGFNFPTGERVAITSTRDVYVPPGVSFYVSVSGDSDGVRLPAVAFAFDVTDVEGTGTVFWITVSQEDYTSARSGWIRSGEPIVTVTGGGSKIRERYDPREVDVVVSVLFGGGNREKLLDFLKISDDKFSALTIEQKWRLLYERDDPAYLRKRLGELFDLFSGK